MNGNATGTGLFGIYAGNHNGTTHTVKTASGTTVSGGRFGIFAKQYGGGALTLTANGNVTAGTYSGIYVRHVAGGDINVTVGKNSTVTSNGTVPGAFAIEIHDGPGDVDSGR